jgi:two-component system, OmpR family, alkaline phosphatase synthesis response regulator PhoP
LHKVKTVLTLDATARGPVRGVGRLELDLLGRWIVKKIMVIEDDLAVLELLGTVLTEAGYAPILIPNSERIPERVMREKPDMILLDIVLQPAHGMEVLSSLSELEFRPPIIMMSAALRGWTRWAR